MIWTRRFRGHHSGASWKVRTKRVKAERGRRVREVEIRTKDGWRVIGFVQRVDGLVNATGRRSWTSHRYYGGDGQMHAFEICGKRRKAVERVAIGFVRLLDSEAVAALRETSGGDA